MNSVIFPATQPSRQFCCAWQARIQAAHEAAFTCWLHAKTFRSARKAAQKMNATAIAFGNHTCTP